MEPMNTPYPIFAFVQYPEGPNTVHEFVVSENYPGWFNIVVQWPTDNPTTYEVFLGYEDVQIPQPFAVLLCRNNTEIMMVDDTFEMTDELLEDGWDDLDLRDLHRP